MLGFDEVCCMAAETANPQVVLPKAVFGTITIVTLLYVLAALSLVGMQPYLSINPANGFSEAFTSNNQVAMAHIVSIGEILCLPLVVLVTFLAQPRIFFAMAEDGLLPKQFAETDHTGNLRQGIVFAGVICSAIAFLVPFTYLEDMIRFVIYSADNNDDTLNIVLISLTCSADVLLSFNLTNSSLVVLHRGRSADGHQAEDRVCASPSQRRNLLSLLLPSVFSFTQYSHILPPASPSSQYSFLSKYKCETLLIIYHAFCIILASLLASAVSPSYDPIMEDSGRMIGVILSVSIFALLASLAAYNISLLPENNDPHSDKQFRVAYMPWPPLIGILFNYCLIALLTWVGLVCLVIYFCTAALYYSLYCLRRTR